MNNPKKNPSNAHPISSALKASNKPPHLARKVTFKPQETAASKPKDHHPNPTEKSDADAVDTTTASPAPPKEPPKEPYDPSTCRFCHGYFSRECYNCQHHRKLDLHAAPPAQNPNFYKPLYLAKSNKQIEREILLEDKRKQIEIMRMQREEEAKKIDAAVVEGADRMVEVEGNKADEKAGKTGEKTDEKIQEKDDKINQILVSVDNTGKPQEPEQDKKMAGSKYLQDLIALDEYDNSQQVAEHEQKVEMGIKHQKEKGKEERKGHDKEEDENSQQHAENDEEGLVEGVKAFSDALRGYRQEVFPRMHTLADSLRRFKTAWSN